ncbi:ABC transporter ATP-binding protein [Bacillus sp. IBL03825]|uniref:ABC transporter ATP-binding protein n=1 Tax=Bacillus sp. IBL03825 TaxID=2953580 RepID=UPI0021578873|nr:ABC transporter ATP-binding protein [Bacillus sp. IBL03825]MCR6850430.1 ABC transporter ATP-binding protein [Bacillus sp. IBL03825]
MISVDIKNVSKVFKTKHENIKAVNNVTFSLQKGTITSLLGPNGSGKTTLIKMICGLIIPDQGYILNKGISVIKNIKEASASVGCILEGERNIYYYLSVYDNLYYFGTLNFIPKRELKKRIDEVLALLDLEEKRYELASNLSRGMQQKLALGITLIKDSDILLLDEPTLGLDVKSTNHLLDTLKKLAGAGKTILLTTHQLDISQRISDDIILFNKGEIFQHTSKDNLLKEANSDSIWIELTLNISDMQKVDDIFSGASYRHIGENKWSILVGNLPSILKNLDKYNIEILDLKKNEKNLEDIFLEWVK